MKYRLFVPIALVLLIFVCACSNRSKPEAGIVGDDTVMADSSFMADSIDRSPFPEHGMEPPEMNGRPPHQSRMEPPPPPPQGKCRPSHKPDNMRGFDPASEDDLDDNGMSRYMENNDEEGWD